MSEITAIQSNVLAQCPGAELPLVQAMLRLTLGDFLRATRVWRDRIKVDVVEDVALYNISPPAVDVGVVTIFAAYYGDYRISAQSTTRLPPNATGEPRVVEQRTPYEIQLYPAPPVDQPLKILTLDVAWGYFPTAVAPTAFEMPRELLAYVDALQHGVLARMFVMVDRPWSSRASYVMHAREYQRIKANARAGADSAWATQETGGAAVYFPPFA